MIKRLISRLFLAWVLGFAWFALLLPLRAAPQKTDGIVVLTGGPGRIDREPERLEAGDATRLLISGVERELKHRVLVAAYKAPVWVRSDEGMVGEEWGWRGGSGV